MSSPVVDVDTVAGLRALDIALPEAARAKLDAYVVLLAKWNRTYNLTAIREPARMITHHVLDALAALPHLPSRRTLRVLDVGSGGGVPGIPIAVARPEWNVTMVDSNRKKTTFLTQAAIELGLANAHAVASRVEDLAGLGPFDVVISRAFADLRTFVDVSAQQLARDGAWYAMKGVLPTAEIAALPPSVEVVASPALQVPGVEGERHLVVMKLRAPSA